MKVLLIHPEDNPEEDPWLSQEWDEIVDLGLGGLSQYARWSSRFHCRVSNLNSLRRGFEDLRRIRTLLRMGCGRLIDEYGLDWWEILSIRLTGELETLILLQRFAQTLAPDDEFYFSRPGLHANLVQSLPGTRAKLLPLSSGAGKKKLRHYLQLKNKLSLSQMVHILGDKYDAGYQFRGRFRSRPSPSTRPVVLLPTAYVNVSRTGIAYANTFPESGFLVVATRRSGWVSDPPKNVAVARLSSYASLRDLRDEVGELESRYASLLKDLAEVPEFALLIRSGYLTGFRRQLLQALGVRDAWRNVLDTEPVEAVLCADDSNPYTGIPLRLARERGIPTIACHHGALDGRNVFKRSGANRIWAKGKMEQDYLVRKCDVPREQVEVGAPALPALTTVFELSSSRDRPYVLFISEAFDISEGRAAGFYEDVLRPLADLALSTGRQLVVKLHPAESERERAALLERTLSPRQKSCARMVSGPLTEELLAKTWIGVTVHSTVAMECAIRGIPCFLCRWLESWPYGYAEQFMKFGVGFGLNEPSEIMRIPEYLQQHRVSPEVKENCWHVIGRGRLRELIQEVRKPIEQVLEERGAARFQV